MIVPLGKNLLSGNRTVNLSNAAAAATVLVPTWVLSLFTPWFDPIRELGLTHPLWRPEIDVAAYTVSAIIALIGYMYLRDCTRSILRRTAALSGTSFVVLIGACLVIKSLIRYAGTEFWIGLTQFVWGAAYILSFSVLAICLLAFFIWVVLTEGVPKNPGENGPEPPQAENAGS